VRAAAERLLARRSAGALLALDVAKREDEIFGALFNTLAHDKPRALTPADYDARLKAHAVRWHDSGPWHVRWGVEGTADLTKDATRFYFDVTPAWAAPLADELTAALDGRGLRRYSFKVVNQLELIDVPVAAVLYVEAPDLDAGRASALAFATAHPEALWPEEAPFTLPLARGLSVADEIGDVGPPGVAGNSFGGAMAHLLARALEGAPPSLDAAGLSARMRTELAAAGFDPEAPWRRPRAATR
jgi:hypothetical protein